jgi:hypothetical protein
MHSMHWWSLPSVNVSALVKDLMLKWHSSVEELQEYFDVFCKREIFYELSTLLTFGRFALRCTKFTGAFVYGMEGWVLFVIKTNALPLQCCDVVLWTAENEKRTKEKNTPSQMTNFLTSLLSALLVLGVDKWIVLYGSKWKKVWECGLD